MELTEAQTIKWCVTVIKRAANHARRRYRNWERDLLVLNASLHDTEETLETIDTVSCPQAKEDFNNVELENVLYTKARSADNSSYLCVVGHSKRGCRRIEFITANRESTNA